MTAFGLAVAIPAVLAYNAFTRVNRMVLSPARRLRARPARLPHRGRARADGTLMAFGGFEQRARAIAADGRHQRHAAGRRDARAAGDLHHHRAAAVLLDQARPAERPRAGVRTGARDRQAVDRRRRRGLLGRRARLRRANSPRAWRKRRRPPRCPSCTCARTRPRATSASRSCCRPRSRPASRRSASSPNRRRQRPRQVAMRAFALCRVALALAGAATGASRGGRRRRPHRRTRAARAPHRQPRSAPDGATVRHRRGRPDRRHHRLRRLPRGGQGRCRAWRARTASTWSASAPRAPTWSSSGAAAFRRRRSTPCVGSACPTFVSEPSRLADIATSLERLGSADRTRQAGARRGRLQREARRPARALPRAPRGPRLLPGVERPADDARRPSRRQRGDRGVRRAQRLRRTWRRSRRAYRPKPCSPPIPR